MPRTPIPTRLFTVATALAIAALSPPASAANPLPVNCTVTSVRYAEMDASGTQGEFSIACAGFSMPFYAWQFKRNPDPNCRVYPAATIHNWLSLGQLALLSGKNVILYFNQCDILNQIAVMEVVN